MKGLRRSHHRRRDRCAATDSPPASSYVHRSPRSRREKGLAGKQLREIVVRRKGDFVRWVVSGGLVIV